MCSGRDCIDGRRSYDGGEKRGIGGRGGGGGCCIRGEDFVREECGVRVCEEFEMLELDEASEGESYGMCCRMARWRRGWYLNKQQETLLAGEASV